MTSSGHFSHLPPRDKHEKSDYLSNSASNDYQMSNNHADCGLRGLYGGKSTVSIASHCESVPFLWLARCDIQEYGNVLYSRWVTYKCLIELHQRVPDAGRDQRDPETLNHWLVQDGHAVKAGILFQTQIGGLFIPYPWKKFEKEWLSLITQNISIKSKSKSFLRTLWVNHNYHLK